MYTPLYHITEVSAIFCISVVKQCKVYTYQGSPLRAVLDVSPPTRYMDRASVFSPFEVRYVDCTGALVRDGVHLSSNARGFLANERPRHAEG